MDRLNDNGPFWQGAAGQLAFGAAFGFVLSRSGFSHWEEVNAMFRFTDWTLLTAFVTAVLLLVVAAVWLRRHDPFVSPRPLHPGSIVGGALFGLGWAATGACPSVVLVQLGEGQGMALVTGVGMLGGNWVYSVVHERWFRWHVGLCGDD